MNEYSVSFYYEQESNYEDEVETVKNFALQSQGTEAKQLFDFLIYFDLEKVFQPVEMITKLFLELLY